MASSAARPAALRGLTLPSRGDRRLGFRAGGDRERRHRLDKGQGRSGAGYRRSDDRRHRPEFNAGVDPCVAMRLGTDGGAAIDLNRPDRTLAFSAIAARQELADRPNAISGVPIVRPDTLEGQPFCRLMSLTADEGAGCLTITGWMVDKPRNAAAAAWAPEGVFTPAAGPRRDVRQLLRATFKTAAPGGVCEPKGCSSNDCASR